MDDFLFRGDLPDVDPDVAALVDLEALRQAKKLIMIASESTVPLAVRQAVGSAFHNIYAEGYPPTHWRTMPEDELLNVDERLAELRRNSGKRYYQGTEIADIIESLAKRRTAERFATHQYSADDLYINVQPLSGAPANSAVYTALIKPGDTLMGMDLIHGGHLTHGSPVARSGLQYNIVSYGVNPENERLDYEQIMALALEHKPKIIVAGFTSYPWAPDWNKFRAIADASGAYLLADVSHVAGLIIAEVYPSPVGTADIVSFTTHKTVGGSRGAVLLTHKSTIASKLDRGVFPGEQGGPHVNNITGLAVAMKLAGTVQFKSLQQQTVFNAKHLAKRLEENGLKVPYGGTDTHMLLVDTGVIRGEDNTPLSGDIAARILDVAGIVCNRNTIPGDKSPFRAKGLRLGTPWITQRGFREEEINQLADVIANLLLAAKPFSYQTGFSTRNWRAKVSYETLVNAQQNVHQLARQAGIDYPMPTLEQYRDEADAAAEHFRVLPNDDPSEKWHSIEVSGEQSAQFLDVVLPSDVVALNYGDWQPTWIFDANGDVMSQGIVERLTEDVYLIHVARNVDSIAQWFISLSDGYTIFDPTDVYAKVPGPVSVTLLPNAVALQNFEGFELVDSPSKETGLCATKAYFVGCHGENQNLTGNPLPIFEWNEPENDALLVTSTHDLHVELGAKMVPFAGYDMPVWYTSVSEEHNATRQEAGLFDVTHMGVFDAIGSGSEAFLNAVTTNDVTRLAPGEAHYSYLLGTDGIPIDDIFIYRLDVEQFMIVVNASNNDKNWEWLNAVKNGDVYIDPSRPWITAPGRLDVELRDLRDESAGDERRVDVALQGPKSIEVLLKLAISESDAAKVRQLKWAEVTQVNVGGHDLIISRTGYTGERVAFELFVHPNEAPALFRKLVNAGATPCGLAARDSLRTEAGLPLYGHELAGDLTMNPADAGFSSFVKLWKPFFIGKQAYLDHEVNRDKVCTRFRLDRKGVRPPQQGDPMMDLRGRVIGTVTSCSIDSDGYQLGQVLVKTDYANDGTPVLIYSNAARTKAGKQLQDLGIGDKATVPEMATIINRFPKRR